MLDPEQSGVAFKAFGESLLAYLERQREAAIDKAAKDAVEGRAQPARLAAPRRFP